MDAAELVVRISSIVEGQVGVLAERLGKTAKALVESLEVKDVLYRAALEPALDAFATKLFDERAGVFLPGFVRLATTAVEALGLNRLIIFASARKLGPCRLYTGVDGQRHSRFSSAFWSELEANRCCRWLGTDDDQRAWMFANDGAYVRAAGCALLFLAPLCAAAAACNRPYGRTCIYRIMRLSINSYGRCQCVVSFRSV
jgi:hypothetical protein